MNIIVIVIAMLLVHVKRGAFMKMRPGKQKPLGKEIKDEELKNVEEPKMIFRPHIHPAVMEKEILKSFRKKKVDKTPCPMLIPNERIPPLCPYKPAGEKGYAKAVCTSFDDRVVCKLGRYTFVINTGEMKMDPEVVERFAAMVYHRAQEGDPCFEVEVDQPEEECYQPHIVQTEVSEPPPPPPPLEPPVFIECSPIVDKTLMINPNYKNSEVIYSCRRKPLGIGKRMVISVDSSGTVSSDDGFVIPASNELKKRLQRHTLFQMHFTPWGPPKVRNFTDDCTTLAPDEWCPTMANYTCDVTYCITTANCNSAAVKKFTNPAEAPEPSNKPDIVNDNKKGILLEPEFSYLLDLTKYEQALLDQDNQASFKMQKISSRNFNAHSNHEGINNKIESKEDNFIKNKRDVPFCSTCPSPCPTPCPLPCPTPCPWPCPKPCPSCPPYPCSTCPSRPPLFPTICTTCCPLKKSKRGIRGSYRKSRRRHRWQGKIHSIPRLQ